MNMRLFEYAPEIPNMAFCLYTGKKHILLCTAREAYKLLQGDNKELMLIPGASHTDLYDQMEIIPFDKLETFLTTHLHSSYGSYWAIQSGSSTTGIPEDGANE